ncbi:hypothetical protein GC088_15085 [Arthrobacter sp. JZ12]|uniref:hypothetical protein n=1 Tax=Arthrobacter sp. JZ12 TaxID=2654190 RepID=UPI002B491A0D|nr:hypothetical protein [Arthrobacter sp. JZ12]WRH26262.1 hypothetical protein GC088_15085 [Arthrobacter sp. JZ12]
MSIEIIVGLVAAAVLISGTTVAAVSAQGRRRREPAPAVLSPEDRRLLPHLGMTPSQWLKLTDSQRANLRGHAMRTM